MLASIDVATNALTARTLGGVWAGDADQANDKVWMSVPVAAVQDYYDPDQLLLSIDPSATGDAGIPDPTPAAPGALPVTITRDVPFTPTLQCLGTSCQTGQLQLDVYAPREPGPWPVVVFAHGGPCGIGCRDYMARQASVLALDGAVVFNADYRDDEQDTDIGDIACAVNFARSTASTYGGDPSRVTLVGYSNGAYRGIYAAVFCKLNDGQCLGTSTSSLPDAFVGVAGGRPAGLVHELNSNPGLLVRLVIGTNDGRVSMTDPRALQAALKQAGIDSTFTLVKGANHYSVFEPGSASPTFGIILAAASRR